MIPMHTINSSNKVVSDLKLTLLKVFSHTMNKDENRQNNKTNTLFVFVLVTVINTIGLKMVFYRKSSETRWYQEGLFFPPRKASAQLWKATCARTLRKTSGLEVLRQKPARFAVEKEATLVCCDSKVHVAQSLPTILVDMDHLPTYLLVSVPLFWS